MGSRHSLLSKGSSLLGTVIFKISGKSGKMTRPQKLRNWKEILWYCSSEGQVYCLIGRQKRTWALEAERPSSISS